MDYKEKVIALLKSQELSKEQKEKLENIFPELKESDDVIRKDMLEYCYKRMNNKFPTITIHQVERWLAWLEKQGEQKPDSGGFWEGYNTAKEKFKQNPAKVGPKFKVGDWIITDKKHIWYVDETPETTSYLYRLINQYGKVEVAEFEVVDEKARLWTIQDAKDGDVLADGNLPFIFKKIDSNKYSYAYCGISVYNDFKIESDGKSGEWTWTQDIKPATKEQRDLLFQKMKEAGYEWDAEKKKLNKIEQKPVWSEEDERLCQCLIEDQEEALDNVNNNKYGHSEIISDLKEMYNERISWLKSLKDRVQPKQEWKQENASDLTDFENAMMHIGDSFFGQHAGLDPNNTNAIKEQANLLLELVLKQKWNYNDEIIIGTIIQEIEKIPSEKFIDNAKYRCLDWLRYRTKSLRPQNR